jgi:hypothetical protein
MNPLTGELAITAKACPERSRRAVAKLLKKSTVLAGFGERIEKTQVSTNIVHQKRGETKPQPHEHFKWL